VAEGRSGTPRAGTIPEEERAQCEKETDRITAAYKLVDADDLSSEHRKKEREMDR